jgi:hypothetical protein
MLVHTRRKPFFSAPTQGDDHCQRIAKDPPNFGNGYEAGEAIQVLEQFEFCHRKSMTSFRPERKRKFPGIYLAPGASHAEKCPLKNALIQKRNGMKKKVV